MTCSVTVEIGGWCRGLQKAFSLKGGNIELNFKKTDSHPSFIRGNVLPLLDRREMLPLFIILPLDV